MKLTPILFEDNATDYVTQGIGALGDVLSGEVTEETNGQYEVRLTYPVTGRRYADLKNRRLIYCKPDPYRDAQPFRIYRITRPLNGIITIYARHKLYDLDGTPVNPFSASNALSAMKGLKANAAIETPYQFWTDINSNAQFSVSVPTSTRALLGGIKGSILDTYGGEYEWDNDTVKLYARRGSDNGVTISYGKNLTDIEQDENIANLCTGIIGYWANSDGELVQTPVVNGPGTYNFANVKAVDFSLDFEAKPTVEQLQKRAQQYVSDNNVGIPDVSITLSWVQLEQYSGYEGLSLLDRASLGDTVTVRFPPLGIDVKARVVKTVYDILQDRYSSVEIGSVKANIADTIANNQQATNEQIKNTTSYLEDRIQQSSDLITNGGGYIYRKFDAAKNWVEIGSTDNLDLSQAAHVWRWNNGGFGHSGNGYNGPYRTAITQDGHIVADFIDTGTLTANIMRAGILQDVEGKAFYLDLPNGVLRMNATELSISGAPAASQSYAQQQAQAAQQAAIAAAAQSLNDYADTVTASLDDLQQQVDGQITTYFYDYKPTKNNAPANEWTTVEEMRRHAGDLFYNTSNGDAYRWAQYYGSWQWLEIVDTDVAAALAAAAAAQDTADSKRRVFTAQPVPPYDVGDLWAEENNGPLQVCITAKASGAAFAAADWTDAANYTAQAAEAGRNLVVNSGNIRKITATNLSYDGEVMVLSIRPDATTRWITVKKDISEYGIENLRGKSVTVAYDYQITETISYDSSGSGAIGALCRLEITYSDGTQQFIGAPSDDVKSLGTAVMQDFVRVAATETVQDKEISTARFVMFAQFLNGTIKYRNPKVELGIFSTPWSPAPEDTEIAAEAPALDQLGTFNKLTNNGQLQGIYMSGGQLYINGSYIRAGTIDASQVNVTNLNADNIKSGTITGRAISGGTITGTSISGGTIEGAKIISRSNGTSVQVYDSKFFVFGTQGTSRLRIQANGDESGEIDFWTTDGFWAGKIRGYRDGDFGRIEVTMGNNGFFTTNRIQTKEIAVTRDDVNGGLYSDGYRSLNGNYLMRYENGIRQCWLDRLALNGGAMYGLQWVNINGYYALCRV